MRHVIPHPVEVQEAVLVALLQLPLQRVEGRFQGKPGLCYGIRVSMLGDKVHDGAPLILILQNGARELQNPEP